MAKKLVAIYTDPYATAKYETGYIAKKTEEFTLLRAIASDAQYDGFRFINGDSIFKVRKNTKYLKKLEQIIRADENANTLYNEINDLSKFIEICMNNAVLVKIELHESGLDDAIGFIDKMCEETIGMKCVNEYGEDNGCSEINIDAISKITVEDSSCKTLMKILK